MEGVWGILIRLNVLYRRILLLFNHGAVRSGIEADDEDSCARVVYGYSDLRGVGLPENVRKYHRVFIDAAAPVKAAFHNPVGNLAKLEAFHIVGKSPCRARWDSTPHGRVLMQNL